ncbi:MAG: hypothetical protein DRG58_11810 [Deltaproteobacteria bacterium]|nr:MAG: hypothetical protein DRG58_11810 [Deltaproteobacteria bacterium]
MKKRILIVEDERIIAEDLKQTLETLGYSVSAIVASGEEAINAVAAQNPDLVLMDIVLKGEMDGIAAAAQIRSLFKIPVVFLSAYGDAQTLERAKVTEPFGYILKPFDNRELHINIEIALHKSRTEKRIEHLNAVLRAIRNVNQLITQEQECDRLIQRACDSLNQTRGYSKVWMALLDESNRVVQTAESRSGDYLHTLRELLEKGELTNCARRALAQAAAVVIMDPSSACVDCPLAPQCQNRRVMITKLAYGGKTYGLLGVSLPAELTVDQEELELFEEVAEDLAFALYSIELRGERQRAAETLQASEALMRSLIESAPVGIGIIQHGKYIYVNPTWLKMLGYDQASEILGREVGSFTVSEHQELVRQICLAKLAGHDVPSSSEIKVFKKTGQPFDILLKVASINYQGKPAILTFLIDVSAEKDLRAQLQQAQKLEAVGTLACGIAHDFNNILQAIQGGVEMLLLDINKDRPEYVELEQINRTSQKGAELIHQILTFTRKAESNLQAINLNDVIRISEKILARTIPRMIAIELQLARDLWTVNVDPGQLEQVLLNLAINARDAMPEGGKLTISTKNVTLDDQSGPNGLRAKPGDYALLSVSDTGFGMSPEVRERIFEPFYTTKELGKGTGLGLAMVYGVVQSHAGYITCDSEPGQGTTFRIYLPALAQAQEVVESRKEQILTIPWQGTETILLVDDEEILRDLGRRMLERFGYRVITAGSGEEALEIFKERSSDIDLVLLDLSMPGIGGIKCLKELIRLQPQARVLVSSGYADTAVNKQVLQAGARGVIHKPYRLKHLHETLREILDQ